METATMNNPPHNTGGLSLATRRYSTNIALYLVLTLLTFGLFNLYWNYRQMEGCNELLAKKEFSFFWWVVLVVITFGLYHFYYQYKMGRALNDIQNRYRLPITHGLPILSLLAAILGVGVIADCIHQYEINRIEAALLRKEFTV